MANTLRSFGLVDRLGLSNFVLSTDEFEISDIENIIASKADTLPTYTDIHYISTCLTTELRREVIGPAWLSRFGDLHSNLTGIKPGTSEATTYHRHVADLLEAIFFEFLGDKEVEQQLTKGRKRVDILFRRVGECRFFDDLKAEGYKCPYIFVECKNYSADPGNPEFDQLSGRLSKRTGNVGCLVVRSVTDKGRTLELALDKLDKGECFFLLTDADIEHMFDLRKKGDVPGVFACLEEKFRALQFKDIDRFCR